ncbi:MAG: hypothetical protein RLY71_2619 [Pseudomonadota bacterium]|jgi:putative NADPH-quinone reductase
MTRILLIQGHPHPAADRQGHRLERAYVEGAAQGGHQVRILQIASLDFARLRNSKKLDRDSLLPMLQSARADILWAEHIVLFSPLWLGMTPEGLADMLEQLTPDHSSGPATRSARVVVTSGLPAMICRLLFRVGALKAIRRHTLRLIGMGQVQETLIGSTSSPVDRWVNRLRDMGREAA